MDGWRYLWTDQKASVTYPLPKKIYPVFNQPQKSLANEKSIRTPLPLC